MALEGDFQQHAICRLTEIIINTLNNNRFIAGVFSDHKKRWVVSAMNSC
jgi:hypothetical protein